VKRLISHLNVFELIVHEPAPGRKGLAPRAPRETRPGSAKSGSCRTAGPRGLIPPRHTC